MRGSRRTGCPLRSASVRGDPLDPGVRVDAAAPGTSDGDLALERTARRCGRAGAGGWRSRRAVGSSRSTVPSSTATRTVVVVSSFVTDASASGDRLSGRRRVGRRRRHRQRRPTGHVAGERRGHSSQVVARSCAHARRTSVAPDGGRVASCSQGWSRSRCVPATPARRPEAATASAARAPAGPGHVPNEPAAWILVDADTGAVLDGRDVRTPHLPASTIKLFTALVAVQRLPADDAVPISEHAAGMPARRIAVGAGQTWDLEDLLVLHAHGVGERRRRGRRRAGRRRLPRRVGGGGRGGGDGLGLEDVPDLTDPGRARRRVLPRRGQPHLASRPGRSSAGPCSPSRELMAMVGDRASTSSPAATGSCTRSTAATGSSSCIPAPIGLKTGLTDAAGRCLVAAATRDGRTMLAVLFDAPDMYAHRRPSSSTAGSPRRSKPRRARPPAGRRARAALDPPERIPGALDPDLGDAARRRGLDWNSAPSRPGPRAGLVPLMAGRQARRRRGRSTAPPSPATSGRIPSSGRRTGAPASRRRTGSRYRRSALTTTRRPRPCRPARPRRRAAAGAGRACRCGR